MQTQTHTHTAQHNTIQHTAPQNKRKQDKAKQCMARQDSNQGYLIAANPLSPFSTYSLRHFLGNTHNVFVRTITYSSQHNSDNARKQKHKHRLHNTTQSNTQYNRIQDKTCHNTRILESRKHTTRHNTTNHKTRQDTVGACPLCPRTAIHRPGRPQSNHPPAWDSAFGLPSTGPGYHKAGPHEGYHGLEQIYRTDAYIGRFSCTSCIGNHASF